MHSVALDQEAEVRHPLVVEHPRQVPAPRVGVEHHDDVVGPASLGHLDRGGHAMPPEPPIRMPSVRLTRRAVRKLSSSLIAMTSSYRSGSQAAGKKSSPTPSTRYGRPEPPENTDPSGSAAMMRMAGFCSFR
jgi:hypothetical protein